MGRTSLKKLIQKRRESNLKFGKLELEDSDKSDDSDDILYKNPRAGADIFERS